MGFRTLRGGPFEAGMLPEAVLENLLSETLGCNESTQGPEIENAGEPSDVGRYG